MLYDHLFVPKPTEPEATALLPEQLSFRDALGFLVMETEPARRLAILQEASQRFPGDDRLGWLEGFLAKRYQVCNQKDIAYTDGLLGLLVSLLASVALHKRKRLYRNLIKSLQESSLLKWDGSDSTLDNEACRELLWGEWMNALHYYLNTCRKDKNYASILSGLIRGSEARVEKQLFESLSQLHEALGETKQANEAQWDSSYNTLLDALSVLLAQLPGATAR